MWYGILCRMYITLLFVVRLVYQTLDECLMRRWAQMSSNFWSMRRIAFFDLIFVSINHVNGGGNLWASNWLIVITDSSLATKHFQGEKQAKKHPVWTQTKRRRTTPSVISPALMNDQPVEAVQQYKHLGTGVDNRSSFDPPCRCCAQESTSAHVPLLEALSLTPLSWKSFILVLLNLFFPFCFICWHWALSVKLKKTAAGDRESVQQNCWHSNEQP